MCHFSCNPRVWEWHGTMLIGDNAHEFQPRNLATVAEIGIIEWPYVWSQPMFTMYLSSVLRAHRLDLVCSGGTCTYSRDFSHIEVNYLEANIY